MYQCIQLISQMQQNVVIESHDIGMIFAAPHLVQEDRALCEPHWIRVGVEHRNDSMVHGGHNEVC